LVLLESRGVAFEQVLQLLESRMGTSGLEEKASRTAKGD
ncbi:MAG TPA: phosphoribosyl-ATP diphosphatase, partial [Hyphomicrobiaceae bacterium]|nr:phosphoribosyl-ATP diphosphatase [Hyphomicrobiaceae bacterium]